MDLNDRFLKIQEAVKALVDSVDGVDVPVLTIAHIRELARRLQSTRGEAVNTMEAIDKAINTLIGIKEEGR
jgi:hypothetical protein